jgi:hypothetical protein
MLSMLWAGMSIIYLSGVIFVWLTFPENAVHAGYGLTGSIAVLALSVLLIAVSAVAVILGASRVPRPARLTVAGALLVVAAGGLVPLAIFDLRGPGPSDSGDIAMAMASAGMVILAVHLIRPPRKDDHGRRSASGSRAYQELLRRSAEIDRRRTG